MHPELWSHETADLNAELCRIERSLEALEAELANVQQGLRDLYRSRIWQVLRWVGGGILRLMLLWSRVRSALFAACGGYSGPHPHRDGVAPLTHQPSPVVHDTSKTMNVITSSTLSDSKPRIAIICQPEYFAWLYETDLDELYEVRTFRMVYSMSVEDYQPLVDYAADLNIFFRGEFVPNGLREKLRGKCINLSSEPFPSFHKGRLNYSLDSLNRLRSFLGCLDKGFDYIFHYDAASLPVLEKIGVHLSGAFYFPIATKVYKPSAASGKKFDFLFTGRSTEHREQLFGRLKHHYEFLHIVHGIFGRDLMPYIHQSRILLNAHVENEISFEPRIQLYLACGAFVLSEEISENPFFDPGIHYVQFEGEPDLFEKAKYYLQHEEERARIAEAGRARTLECLSADRCFDDLIRNVLDDKFEKPSSRVRDEYLEILELCATYPNQEFDHLLDYFHVAL